MENNKIYPEGTIPQTEDFALRQKIKKIVGENIEQIIKSETYDAFEKLGYEEKDDYLYIIAAGGNDNKEREVGKGVKEGKINVTVSTPKMLNMGAVKPVSYMQKVTTFGGKRIVSEIYLEIKDKIVFIDYKNTEASSFHQQTEKHTYAPNKLSKSGSISGIENEKSFVKDFKDFFKSIAEEEANYLVGTKIGSGDKIEKDMNDSIVKENKFNMKLSDILSSSYDEIGSKIDNLMSESLQVEEFEKKEIGTPETPSGKPTKKELVIGSEDKTEEDEEKLEEITVSGAGIGGATDPSGFKYAAPGWANETPKLNANKDYTQVSEAVRNTTYGMMRTVRPHLTRQESGSYKLITESDLKTPYEQVVPMGEDGWPPKGMEHNFALGKHGVKVNSSEELAETGHGDLSQLEKNTVDESYKKALDLTKRKFASLTENEEKGINKRYIITEKLSKESQVKRWKELYENDCFCGVKDRHDTVSRDEYEDEASKEFSANNPLESDLSDTPFSGEKEGFIDTPKAKGSMIVFRISESDIKANKMYLIDHFTNKLVLNPLHKIQE